MNEVLPQNEKDLRDAFGSPLGDGACVVDAERQVGYVCHPLRTKVMTVRLVQRIGSAS